MGNCCNVEGAIDHWIYIKTGDRKGAGTDVNCKAILHDEKGNKTQELHLCCYFKTDYEKGQTDIVQCPPLGKDFGRVVRVEIWRDDPGVYPNWFCELIVVNDRRVDKCYYFPILRWLRSNRRYKFEQLDTLLPQYDPNHQQRREELDEKRLEYTLVQREPELPMQVQSLPQDEQFSDEHKRDIMQARSQVLSRSALPRMMRGHWSSLDEITTLYDNMAFYEPAGVDRWSNDLCFGAQRLMGCNPTMIRLCNSLPENMSVTAEMLKPFLEGWTMKQIIEAKRLYYVDLKIVEDLPTKDDNEICSPVALFFVTGAKQLVPIAIQLYQDIAPDNPVYLPDDPPFTWMLAKMWFNHADASVHQSITHFAYTHLLTEGIAASMQRNVSPSHPIYKLLAPHLVHLLSINSVSLNKLLEPNGWVDSCMSIGRDGVKELIKRGCDEWRLDVQGNFQRELDSRGVLDPKTLPNYAYRDDGLMIHKAVDAYVKKILRHYYPSDAPGRIQTDHELQAWVKELSLSKEEGGVGLQGVPVPMQKEEQIRLLCNHVIFTCSAQHAAVSFSQYDEYGFPPNYPLYLDNEPPYDKLPKSEEDILQILPTKDKTLDTMVMTQVLSARGTQSLGEWYFQYQYDPFALAAEKEFREELQQISKVIKRRNEERDEIYTYPFLDPEVVPSSITI